MTTAQSLDGQGALRFENNREYISWEFGRLRRQMEAYIRLQNDHSFADEYYDLLGRLAVERQVAVQARREAVSRGVSIPFEQLSRRFHLTGEDEEILLFCLTPQHSHTVWNVLVAAQGNLLKPYLEVGFVAERVRPAADLVTDRPWYKPNSALVRNGLIMIEAPEDGSSAGILCHSVRVPYFVASIIMGRDSLENRLTDFCELTSPTTEPFEVVLPEQTRQTVDGFIKSFYRGQIPLELEQKPRTILINGPAQCGKTTLARSLAWAFRRPQLTVYLDRLPKQSDGAQMLQLAFHNARLLGAILHMNRPEQLLEIDPQLIGCLCNFVDQYQGLVVFESQQPEKLGVLLKLVDLVIHLDYPEFEEREQLWESLIPPDVQLARSPGLKELASVYELTGGQIKRAIEWAKQLADARDDQQVYHDDLLAGAQSQLRSRIGDFAVPSKARLTLDDLVLPQGSLDLVKELLQACRYNQKVMSEWGFSKRLVTGRGLVALFTGDPGTGKTLCAEILAQELGLSLHIVSIPKIVSKWVGETEQHIREVFQQARAQNSMLLFDEADSLFSKRVQVERSQDHYLNMEVNMFLQEIERFEGITLLTTNLETNIDRAFQRRILFKIEFLMPGQKEREKIWRRLIPQETPLEQGIDFEFLAEAFELSGGQIKNAIIRAAYQSCGDGGVVSQGHLEKAAQQQARADGKLTRSMETMKKERDAKRAGKDLHPTSSK
ncbi:MAG: ATP-binding protein [Bradymonadales bacterium]|nr:ATP-binding protein [Bradymonadales bacterium]